MQAFLTKINLTDFTKLVPAKLVPDHDLGAGIPSTEPYVNKIPQDRRRRWFTDGLSAKGGPQADWILDIQFPPIRRLAFTVQNIGPN